MMNRVLTIGQTILQIDTRISKQNYFYNTSYADYYREIIGGRAANMALCLRKFGIFPVLFSKVGSDGNGERIYNLLKSKEVDVRYLFIDKNKKTSVNINIDSGSKMETVKYLGASYDIDGYDLDEALTSRPESIHISSDVNQALLARIYEYADNRMIPVFTSYYHSDGAALSLFNGSDVIFFTIEDLEKMTGSQITRIEDCIRAGSYISKEVPDCKFYVIDRKEKGYFFNNGIYYDTVSSFDLKIEDTSYRREAFESAFISDYLKNGDYKHACEFANVISSLACSKGGGYDSLPDAKEVTEFVKNNSLEYLLKNRN